MGKLSYLSVKNITDAHAEIYIYGDVVGDEWEKWCDTDTCPQDVIDALRDAQGKDVDVYINSGGGSVFAGVAIYNMLKRHTGKVTVHIDALAASIASVIAMAGDEIIMPNNSLLMIHKPAMTMLGTYNANELQKMAEDLDVIENSITAAYSEKIKSDVGMEEIKQMMADETWLTAEEASKYFDVNVVEANAAVAKVSDDIINSYKRAPAQMKNRKPPKQQEEKENRLKLLQADLDLVSE